MSIYYYYYLDNNERKNNKQKFKYIWFVLTGVCIGLAMLTKINSLFLYPFIGLEILIIQTFKDLKSNKEINIKNSINIIKNTIKPIFLLTIISIITFFIVWPAMWVAPIETLNYVKTDATRVGYEEGHTQLFLGKVVENPGGLFYPVVLLIRYSIHFFLLWFIGFIFYCKNNFKFKNTKNKLTEKNKLLTISLAFIIFYLIFLAIPNKKLGRYSLPIAPFLTFFATFPLLAFIQKISKNFFNKYLTSVRTLKDSKTENAQILNHKSFINFFMILTCSLLFIVSVFSTRKIFPNYLMYYNPVIGGYIKGNQIEEQKWPLGYNELAKVLNDYEEAKERRVLVRYGYLFNPFYKGPTGFIDQETEKDAPNIFVAEEIQHINKYINHKKIKLKEVVKVGGIDFFWVYEIEGSKTKEERENNIKYINFPQKNY